MDAPLTTAIEVNAVTKCFGEVRAVDLLDLVIGRGETVALLGPNGAGRSSAIQKTGARNRIEAAQTARNNGWL